MTDFDALLIGLGSDSDDDIAILAVRPVPPRPRSPYVG
ncbi:hypothetical protein RKD18_005275 [Streptomyces phaeoluteigriseus]